MSGVEGINETLEQRGTKSGVEGINEALEQRGTMSEVEGINEAYEQRGFFNSRIVMPENLITVIGNDLDMITVIGD